MRYVVNKLLTARTYHVIRYIYQDFPTLTLENAEMIALLLDITWTVLGSAIP